MPTPLRQVDTGLKAYATPRQCEYIDAVNKYRSARQAAESLGVDKNAVIQAIRSAERAAARQGYAPGMDLVHPVPDAFHVKGVSTLYDKSGDVAAQWVKTDRNKERAFEALKEAAQALSDDLSRAKPVPPPKQTAADLCNTYTMTDCHLGMYAWHREGGEDWDLNIAERVLTGCFAAMVNSSVDAETGVVAVLGDWLHYDSLAALTPTSGHILDADGRYAKMVQVGVKVIRGLVDCALRKHDRVVLLIAEGNHDIAGSVWLRAMFQALYEAEPRVTVIDSELPFYAYQHGSTMLCWHHGHLKKNDALPLMMASQFSEMWGATKKRYCHTGDKHHVDEKEHSGMIVCQHPTLAARDAYASRHGWHALRSANCITYHRQHGEVARVKVCPEMLEAAE